MYSEVVYKSYIYYFIERIRKNYLLSIFIEVFYRKSIIERDAEYLFTIERNVIERRGKGEGCFWLAGAWKR